MPGVWNQVPAPWNKPYTSGTSSKGVSKGVSASLHLLPEDPLCSARQPSVTADESKMNSPHVHAVWGYGFEVQLLPVARSPIMQLQCGHLQRLLIHAVGVPLFLLAYLYNVYLVPQSSALTGIDSSIHTKNACYAHLSHSQVQWISDLFLNANVLLPVQCATYS